MHKIFIVSLFILLIFLLGTFSISAQTDSFTYQGGLKEAGAPASGNYDITVEMYDAATGGSMLGSQIYSNVPVTNGVFTLNIGAAAGNFPGASRWIQLNVRRSGTATFTTLAPRQLITTTPYAFKSENSSSLGGVPASQYVLTNDPRMSNARPPMAGSTSYIQNSLTQQAASNFNISDNGLIGGRLNIGTLFSDGYSGFKLRVEDPNSAGLRVGTSTPGGTVASFGPYGNFEIDKPGFAGGRFSVKEDGRVGIGTDSPSTALNVVGQDIRVESPNSNFPRYSWNYALAAPNSKKWQVYVHGGLMAFSALNDAENAETIWMKANRQVGTINIIDVEFPTLVKFGSLDSAGSTTLCRNANNRLATCSSSIRYKQNIENYSPGLDLIKRLRPVSFNWKADSKADMGLVAEEVASVEPLLTTTNEKGDVEGVKYDRVGVVAVNAIKEQQTQIEVLQKENQELKARLDRLEKLVRQAIDGKKEKEQ